ncbi:MAG: energy transducer TonB [Pseudomonadota bacterium]
MEYTLWQRTVAAFLAISLHAIVLITINYKTPGQLLTGLEGFHVSIIPAPSFVPDNSALTEDIEIEEVETIELVEEVEEVEIVEMETIEEIDAVEVVEIKPEPLPVETPTVQVKQKKIVEKKAVAKKEVQQQTNTVTTEQTDSFHDKAPTMARGAVTDTGTSRKIEASYKAIVSAILQKHKQYPSRALRRKQEGTVTVVFTIDNDGSLAGYEITDSSGYKLLDRAVEKMLKRATPLPPFPDNMDQDSITLILPVDFYIKS